MKSLNTFYAYRYIFNLEALEDIILPPFKGSALRGVFGNCLKEQVCQRVESECIHCLSYCPYNYLFAIKEHPDFPSSRKYRDPPRPYILNPPLDKKIKYRAGESFSFEVVLIGRARDYLPQVISTFHAIGQRGFQHQNVRGRFVLTTVTGLDAKNHTHPVYNNGRLQGFGELISFKQIADTASPVGQMVSLSFQTPLKLEVKGRQLKHAPSMDVLTKTIFHRASLLNLFHCGGLEISDDLIDYGSNITIMDSDLCMVNLLRRPTRKKEVNISGLMGSVTYRGPISAGLISLLRLGEIINVGKWTILGHGHYQLMVDGC